jgi:succinyl-diaminopimelate desuccinylase
MVWGRGVIDVKSGVAAFVAAAVDFARQDRLDDQAIILTITRDEEGTAAEGPRAILDWMKPAGERIDV